jgi:hypothetical protein
MVATALLMALTGRTEAASSRTPPAGTRDIRFVDDSHALLRHRQCRPCAGSAAIQIKTRSGAVVLSFAPVTLAPEEGTSRCVTAEAAYCQFDVLGRARSYRAMAIYDAAGAYRISLPAY